MAHLYSQLKANDIVLEKLPDGLNDSLRQRAERRRALGAGAGLKFAFDDLRRWRPGSVVRIAFLGGDVALHRKIVEVVGGIAAQCHLGLDFGWSDEQQAFRSWSEEDTEYAAEIRVSFDLEGYWSLLGTDAVDASLGASDHGYGGQAHQRSLNLGGFAEALPEDWKHVVLHEFMHALAFEHEHQNMRGQCEAEFRWEDDPAYVATKDERGAFVADGQGRRPGIYSYLSGYPNEWNRDEVDAALRSDVLGHATLGTFDPASVMLYRFPKLFYRSDPSPCAPEGDGTSLSNGDIRGLHLLYGESPENAASYAASINTVRAALTTAKTPEAKVAPALKAKGSSEPTHLSAETLWLDRLWGEDGVATLPSQDPDPAGRQKLLDEARETWRYEFQAMGPLVATAGGVPGPDVPSIPWFAKVGRRAAEVGLNSLAVKAFWWEGVHDPRIGLRASSAAEAAMQGAIKDAMAAHQLLHERLGHWEDDGLLGGARRLINRGERDLRGIADGSEAELKHLLNATESDFDGLQGEVESRLKRILGEGLHSDGFEGVPGPSGRPSSIADYAKLFRKIPLPHIADVWQEDETFAWLRVAGPNPRMLRRMTEVLEHFPIDATRYAAVVPGDSLPAALEQGRLFVCDWEMVGAVLIPAKDKYVTAPLALFAVPPGGGNLVPVAIQCGQTPGPETPVIMADEGLRWQLAKSVVQTADANQHELVAHLARTHLYIEVVLLATRRDLSSRHPVFQLLVPHFEGTVFINDSARSSLIAKGGAIQTIFAGTLETSQKLAAKGVETFDYNEHLLPKFFERMGSEAIADYPYRDDALLLWKAISVWVSDYLDLFYMNDAQLVGDPELRAWNGRLRCSVAEGGLPGIPEIQTKGALVELLTHFIFTASCEHAAVNFPQRTDMAYAPAMSGAGWRAAPAPGETITEQDRLDFMPPVELAMQQMEVLNVIGAVYYTHLGEYHANRFPYRELFRDPRVQTALSKFRSELAVIEKRIAAKNADRSQRSQAYVHLLPSKVPMSVNI